MLKPLLNLAPDGIPRLTEETVRSDIRRACLFWEFKWEIDHVNADRLLKKHPILRAHFKRLKVGDKVIP